MSTPTTPAKPLEYGFYWIQKLRGGVWEPAQYGPMATYWKSVNLYPVWTVLGSHTQVKSVYQVGSRINVPESLVLGRDGGVWPAGASK